MTGPGGLSPKGMLKIAALVPLAIIGVFGALAIIGAIQTALGTLSQAWQGIVLVTVGTIAWVGRRYLRLDRERREREQARVSGAVVAHAWPPAASPAPVLAPLVAPAPVIGNPQRWGTFLQEIAAETPSKIREEVVEEIPEEIPQEAAVGAAQYEVDHRTDEVAAMLGRVTGVLAMVVEHIDENRQQMQELTRAVSDISGRPAIVTDYVDISLPEEEHLDDVSAGERLEVWSGELDRWIGGVEIVEVSRENGRIRFWLRRRSDGYIFPQAFDLSDVRIEAGAVASLSSV